MTAAPKVHFTFRGYEGAVCRVRGTPSGWKVTRVLDDVTCRTCRENGARLSAYYGKTQKVPS